MSNPVNNNDKDLVLYSIKDTSGKDVGTLSVDKELAAENIELFKDNKDFNSENVDAFELSMKDIETQINMLGDFPKDNSEFTAEYKNKRETLINNVLNSQLAEFVSAGQIDSCNKLDMATFYESKLKNIEEFVKTNEKELEEFKKNNPQPDKNDTENYNLYQEKINSYEMKIKCGKFDCDIINESYRTFNPSVLQKFIGTGADILENIMTGMAINKQMHPDGNPHTKKVYGEIFFTF